MPSKSYGDHLEGKRLNEKYRIKKVVQWSEHTVFCDADNLANNRVVNLVLLNGTLLKNDDTFKSLCKRKMALKHKNILLFHDYGATSDGESFVVFEKLPPAHLSGPLKDHTSEDERRKAINSIRNEPKSMCRFVIEILDGLEYAAKTDEPIILPFPHRIHLDKTSPKISPLNFREIVPESSFVINCPSPGAQMRYMPPECLKEEKADQRSQIYTLGCILYQLLTGKAPFESDDLVELESQQLCVAPQRFHEVRPDLYFNPKIEAVVLKALAKDRSARYASLKQFKSAILEAMSTQSPLLKKAMQVACGVALLGISAFCVNSFVMGSSGHANDPINADPVVEIPVSVVDPDSQNSDPLAALPLPPADATKLGSIKLAGNEQKVLKSGNYVCDSLFLSGNARVYAEGDVHLWITPSDRQSTAFRMENSSELSTKDSPDKFLIYDLSLAPINISGTSKIRSTVHAPGALLDAFDNAAIGGVFISNGQRLNGHAHFINESTD